MTLSYTLTTLTGTWIATGPLTDETMIGFGSGTSSGTDVTPPTATSCRLAESTLYLVTRRIRTPIPARLLLGARSRGEGK